jgi:hypothetical protein
VADDTNSAFLDHIHRKIDEYGVTVIAVAADEETPQFAYTIGLTPRHGYELAMNGCDFDDMHHALNQISQRADRKELAPVDGLLIEGVLADGYLLRLKLANPSWSGAFPWVQTALGVAAPPLIWQVQFPDKDGRWPGKEGYDPAPYTQVDYTLPRQG